MARRTATADSVPTPSIARTLIRAGRHTTLDGSRGRDESGGTVRVSIGERSLLGANAGIGIALGDDCVVEAGLYVTAGSKVVLADGPNTAEGGRKTVKAAELSGRDGILFWRNSVTGAIEAKQRAGVGVTLNEALHA